MAIWFWNLPTTCNCLAHPLLQPAHHPLLLPALTQADKQGEWQALAKEVRATVAKVLFVEESLASNVTCLLCLDVFKQPQVCREAAESYASHAAACIVTYQTLVSSTFTQDLGP